MTVSARMTDEQQPKQPRWWIPITFGILLTWLVNNLITILTFIGTGAVNVSHVGIAPFLAALGLSVLICAVGLVLGIRLCISALLAVSAAAYHMVVDLASRSASAQSSGAAARVRQDGLTPKEQFQAMMDEITPPSPPATRWDTLRDDAEKMLATILLWLFFPKWFRKKLRV
jgi:hypothetical protein